MLLDPWGLDPSPTSEAPRADRSHSSTADLIALALAAKMPIPWPLECSSREEAPSAGVVASPCFSELNAPFLSFSPNAPAVVFSPPDFEPKAAITLSSDALSTAPALAADR